MYNLYVSVSVPELKVILLAFNSHSIFLLAWMMRGTGLQLGLIVQHLPRCVAAPANVGGRSCWDAVGSIVLSALCYSSVVALLLWQGQ
jgi:hypothetical protein